ncbi:MAG: hypothetical protein H7138_14600, partial [Myxococcales bacterium]|nr:hypothetical protein [Myxococcales bacterium]
MRSTLGLVIVASVISWFVACGKVQPLAPDAASCTSAAQCTTPGLPFCVGGQCQAACAGAGDCTSADAPICAADGACVGCIQASDCAGDAPVCDADDRACRGCAEDAECPGGVCVEAEGRCVADADVSFATMMGNDTGTCTRTAPCASLTYAIAQAGRRPGVHVLGGTLFANEVVTVTGNRVIDGEGTALRASGTTFAVTAPAKVTIEGFLLAGPSDGMAPAINITGAGAIAVLSDLQITGSGAVITAGSSTDVTLTRSHIGNLVGDRHQVSCSNGKMRVTDSVFENSVISPLSGNCELTVARNRFESNNDGSVQLVGGRLVMENNLVIHRDGFNDSILAAQLAPGSTIRFNTIVNTTAVASDGAAISCDNTVEVTSNIIAYNSGNVITGQGCVTRYSIFDEVAKTSAGTGNQVTNLETIFVNRGAGDYHLA